MALTPQMTDERRQWRRLLIRPGHIISSPAFWIAGHTTCLYDSGPPVTRFKHKTFSGCRLTSSAYRGQYGEILSGETNCLVWW